MEYIVIGLLLAIGVIIYNYYELTHLELNEYTIINKKIDKDYEFLILSDLHDNIYGKNNCKLLKMINDTNVKNIIIAGDMVTGKKKSDWKSTMEFISVLAKNHKIYYVNGNHETKTKYNVAVYGGKYKEYKEKLQNIGVVFLEDEFVEIGNIRVYGFELDKKYYSKLKKCKFDYTEMKKQIGCSDDSYFNILVAHNPRYIDDYCKWYPDLIISGHFHGGVLRIPKIGGVISPQFDVFPRYSGGIYNIDDIIAIVSKGLGTHSVNLRFFNKPEVIKIKLQKY